MKKCIKIFLIILLVCIIGSVIVLIIRNNNKLSIEEIKSLLDKGKSISNVYFEHTVLEQNEEEYTMKKYLKDDTYVFEIDNSYQWINFSTDEWIYIDNTNKTISVTDTKNCDKFNENSCFCIINYLLILGESTIIKLIMYNNNQVVLWRAACVYDRKSQGRIFRN